MAALFISVCQCQCQCHCISELVKYLMNINRCVCPASTKYDQPQTIAFPRKRIHCAARSHFQEKESTESAISELEFNVFSIESFSSKWWKHKKKRDTELATKKRLVYDFHHTHRYTCVYEYVNNKWEHKKFRSLLRGNACFNSNEYLLVWLYFTLNTERCFNDAKSARFAQSHKFQVIE